MWTCGFAIILLKLYFSVVLQGLAGLPGNPGAPGEPGRPGRDGLPGPKVSPYCNPFASKSQCPVNMLDPIPKCLGYGQLWPLQPACSQNWAGSYMPDPTSCIQIGSVFPKKAQITICRTNPFPIWMAWSGFGQMYLARKQDGVQESSDLSLIHI